MQLGVKRGDVYVDTKQAMVGEVQQQADPGQLDRMTV
jgi:hypothetical protein